MNGNDSKKEILIVDDSPINISLLGAELHKDYELKIATNGEEALKIAYSTPPDLVLLDIEMPGMNGYQVCKQLKENQTTLNIPVIFITAKATIEDEMKGLEMGAVDYIVKPFCIPIVKARVKTHITLKIKSDILESLTCIDSLTNIFNRRRFDESLKQEWGKAMRFQETVSIILIDIDFFKKYNDNYGHPAGDDCLAKVAKSLERCLGRSSDFVARYGGEEFVAVLTNTQHAVAKLLAEKMRASIEELAIPHAYSEATDNVSISLGVATTIPTSRLTTIDLIKAADSALYEAKEQGRNQVKSIILK